MKYLVLGSSGQIGRHLVSFLVKSGHDVHEIDLVRDSSEDLRIANNKKLLKCMEDSDFVFFLAFDVGGSRYLKKYQNTFSFIQNNIKIMSNTFEQLHNMNKQFIFTSSQMSDMGYSNYGLCKSIGEKYTESLGGINVKMWNVYGHERDMEKSHVITDFVLKCKEYGKIEMLTTGEEQRQFLHVDDCCRCLYVLSEKYSTLSREEEYHITNFEWTSIMDIAKEVSSNFENIEIIPSDKRDMVHRGWKLEPDKNILKYWKPKISLKEGIKDIIMRLEDEDG